MANLIKNEKSADSNSKSAELLKPWMEMTQSKAFLASEFLLWLWYFIESKQNPTFLPLNSNQFSVKLWIEDKIVLESTGSKAHCQTLKGGDPSGSIEAVSGLLSGKTVKELKIGLHVDTYGEFSVLLSAKDLSPKAIQLPSPDNAPSTLEYRLKTLDILLEAIDHLFLSFLEQRVKDNWVTEAFLKIETWIESRGHQETALH